MKLSAYAKQEGLTYRTALRYYHNGMIKGIQLPTGTILVEDTPLAPMEGKPRTAALYRLVSSSRNKKNLESQQTQLEALETYAASRGYLIGPNVREIGSALNDQRPELLKLFKDDWNVLLVENKSQLTAFGGFGYDYLDAYAQSLGRSIEIVSVSEEIPDSWEMW